MEIPLTVRKLLIQSVTARATLRLAHQLQVGYDVGQRHDQRDYYVSLAVGIRVKIEMCYVFQHPISGIVQ